MIKLNVDTYCHSCNKFEPIAEKYYEYDFETDLECITEIEVRCVNKDLCYNLWKHMLTEGRR